MFRLLDKGTVEKLIPLMEEKKVSVVARGKKPRPGFTTIFLNDVDLDTKVRPNQTWRQKRRNFLKRHTARKNPLWRKGQPTRQHLALIAWAYSPTPKKLKTYIDSMD